VATLRVARLMESCGGGCRRLREEARKGVIPGGVRERAMTVKITHEKASSRKRKKKAKSEAKKG